MEKLKLSDIAFLILLLGCALVLRLYSLGNMNLMTDEAYYWEWSRHLSFGYFSHPPFVAWTIFLARLLLGNSEWQIRLPFSLFGLITIIASYLLAKELLNRKAAIITVAFVAFSPAYVLVSRLALPDQLVITFWVLAMLFYWKSISASRTASQFFFGIFLGLGLLSKYQMFFLLFSVIAFHIFTRKKPKLLILGLSISALVFLPNIIWNSTHGWPSFIFQVYNSSRLSFPNGLTVKNLIFNFFYTVYQAVLYPDILVKIVPLTTVAFVYLLRNKKPQNHFFLLFSFIPIFVFFSFTANLHWIFPGLIGIILLLAYLLEEMVKNKILLFLIVLNVCLVNTLFSLKTINFFASGNQQTNFLDNPTYALIRDDSIYWKKTVQKIATETGYEKNEQTFVAQSYPVASEIAYYMPGHPLVFAPQGQYLLWGPPKQWKNISIISFDPNFIEKPNESFLTPRGTYYYKYYRNNPPDFSWKLNWQGP